MIQVRRAKRTDIPKLTELMKLYGKMSVDKSLINHRDIALVAVAGDEIVGFAYCGLMAENTRGYVDKVVADPAWGGKGVVAALYAEMGRLLVKLGVRSIFGLIKRDEFHDRAVVNALKFAMQGDATPYTYVYTDVAFAKAELESLGER